MAAVTNCCESVRNSINCDDCKNGTCDLDCWKKWTRIVLIGASAILAALGIGRFFSITEMLNPFSWVLNVYLM